MLDFPRWKVWAVIVTIVVCVAPVTARAPGAAGGFGGVTACAVSDQSEQAPALHARTRYAHAPFALTPPSRYVSMLAPTLASDANDPPTGARSISCVVSFDAASVQSSWIDVCDSATASSPAGVAGVAGSVTASAVSLNAEQPPVLHAWTRYV